MVRSKNSVSPGLCARGSERPRSARLFLLVGPFVMAPAAMSSGRSGPPSASLLAAKPASFKRRRKRTPENRNHFAGSEFLKLTQNPELTSMKFSLSELSRGSVDKAGHRLACTAGRCSSLQRDHMFTFSSEARETCEEK